MGKPSFETADHAEIRANKATLQEQVRRKMAGKSGSTHLFDQILALYYPGDPRKDNLQSRLLLGRFTTTELAVLRGTYKIPEIEDDADIQIDELSEERPDKSVEDISRNPGKVRTALKKIGKLSETGALIRFSTRCEHVETKEHIDGPMLHVTQGEGMSKNGALLDYFKKLTNPGVIVVYDAFNALTGRKEYQWNGSSFEDIKKEIPEFSPTGGGVQMYEPN